MIRAIVYGLLSIILITLVRAFVGIIARAMTNSLKEAAAPNPNSAPRGELRKCVVCGTYAPVSTAPKVKGIDDYLCSDACVQKYRA